MNIFLGFFLVLSAFLVIYWFIWGQRKHEMLLNPPKEYKLKAVFFDLDGVLVDTFDAWHAAINKELKKNGYKEQSKEEHRKKCWGRPLEEGMQKLFKGHDMKAISEDIKREIEKNVDKVALMPHAKELLRTIQKKHKIALITNNYRPIVKKMLAHHKLDSYFDEIITIEDVQNPKPYPDALLKALEKFKLEPPEAIYIGDTPHDFKAAKAARIGMIGIGTRGNLVADSLKDIIPLFKEDVNNITKTSPK